jgi:hypothetical protein
MGGLSSLNKERKRGFKHILNTDSIEKELKRGARKVKREASREVEDVIDATGVGQVLSPKDIRIAGKDARQAGRRADAVQLKQKRATQLENAKLSNEIALIEL